VKGYKMKTNDKAINNFNIEFNNGTLYVSLVGNLNHLTVPEWREKVDIKISEFNPSCVVLDFSQVDSMDATGLGFIMGRSECLMELGGKLIIEKPNESVSHLLNIAGIKKVKNIKVNKK
jgi:anti-anti-sigma factor